MKKLALLVIVAPMVLIACGEGDTTTVVKETEAPAETTTVVAQPPEPPPSQTPAPKPAPPPEPAGCSDPPDVVGLSLPLAKRKLTAAGCGVSVSNTDTTFGIIVPDNYTVCTQDEPNGNRVPILAQKYGC